MARSTGNQWQPWQYNQGSALYGHLSQAQAHMHRLLFNKILIQSLILKRVNFDNL